MESISVLDIFKVLADVLAGIKLRPVDVKKEKKYRLIEEKQKLQDIRSKMMSIITDRGKTNAEKKEKLKELSEQIEKVMDKATQYGEIDVERLRKLGE